MKKMSSFFSKPRNIYFSLVALLCVFSGLLSISFSYFIDPSTNNTKLVKVNKVNNVIKSEQLDNGVVSIEPHKVKNIEITVISNNKFDSIYNIIYKNSNSLINVSTENVNNKIKAQDFEVVKIKISNESDEAGTVIFDIINAYPNNKLISPEDYTILKSSK